MTERREVQAKQVTVEVLDDGPPPQLREGPAHRLGCEPDVIRNVDAGHRNWHHVTETQVPMQHPEKDRQPLARILSAQENDVLGVASADEV